MDDALPVQTPPSGAAAPPADTGWPPAAEPMRPADAPSAPPPMTAEQIAALAAAAPVPTAEEIAALAAAAEAAIPAVPPLVPTPAAAGTETTVEAPKRRRLRLFRVGTGVARLAGFAVGIVLFAVGLTAGVSLYQRSLPVAPLVGDPSTGGVATPAVVAELVEAMVSNNADSIRSVVNNDSYRLLAGELQTWQIQGVTSVKALATMVDGDRSATQIVISGKTSSGNPIIINLVVQVKAGTIVSFR